MTTSKLIHLWEDGTWDEQGGHWIAVRQEEWEEMLNAIASASSLERGRRLGALSDEKWSLLRERLKVYRTGLRKAEAWKRSVTRS